MSRSSMLLLQGAISGLMILSVLGLLNYTGSRTIFALFCACYVTLVGLIVPKPRTYVFLFFGTFLFLGFWLKVIAHFVWHLELVEPVGNFTFAPAEWDTALLLATSGGFGAVVVRGIHLWMSRKRADLAVTHRFTGAPAWFIAWRRPVWTITLILIVAVNALNYFLAFYQIGVNPKVILPMHANVIPAWLINIGFALWVATLIHWDMRAGKGYAGGFVAAMFEALLSSLSAQSRFFFLLHAGPYWLVSAERWRNLRIPQWRIVVPLLVVSFALLLWLSISTVSRIRYEAYFETPDLPPAYTAARYYDEVFERHLSRLFVQRWVGLEGALTAISAPGRSFDLLHAVLTENPRRGADSIFQKVAKVPYAATDSARFTFLSNAGPIALLGFSDSLLVPFLGMALLVLILLGSEHLAQRITGNAFLVSVAGAGLANVATQMTFPYLSMIFLLQLTITIAAVALVQRVGCRVVPSAQ